MSAPFRHFAAIDWSGAAGERHHGIAVALCGAGDATPQLVRPGHRWSRADVLDWLTGAMPEDTLVGMDLGQALPHADCGAYFPGWAESPSDARGLWAMVDRLCADDAHLGCAGLVDHPEASRYFRRHGGRSGDRFGKGAGRLRVTELHQRAQGLNPYSNFNLVGAAQVGKSSLTGMRLFHRLGGAVPIWPIDPRPARGSVIVEIYTSLAALAAGRRKGATKMRDVAALNQALGMLGSAPCPAIARYSDHVGDAILTAAWLRHVHARPALWHPKALTPAIAASEGWTFGVS